MKNVVQGYEFIDTKKNREERRSVFFMEGILSYELLAASYELRASNKK